MELVGSQGRIVKVFCLFSVLRPQHRTNEHVGFVRKFTCAYHNIHNVSNLDELCETSNLIRLD